MPCLGRPLKLGRYRLLFWAWWHASKIRIGSRDLSESRLATSWDWSTQRLATGRQTRWRCHCRYTSYRTESKWVAPKNRLFGMKNLQMWANLWVRAAWSFYPTDIKSLAEDPKSFATAWLAAALTGLELLNKFQWPVALFFGSQGMSGLVWEFTVWRLVSAILASLLVFSEVGILPQGLGLWPPGGPREARDRLGLVEEFVTCSIFVWWANLDQNTHN